MTTSLLISELLEAVGQTRTVYASARWPKDWAVAVQTRDFEKNFDAWLDHWKNGAVSHVPYDIKDAPLTGNSRISNLPRDPVTQQTPPKVRRWHAISGKIIVLYQLYPDAVLLIAAGPHDIEEKKNLDIIGNWLKDYRRADWREWAKPQSMPKTQVIPKVKPLPLSAQELDTLDELLLLLAQDTDGQQVISQLSKLDALPWLMWARTAIGLDPMDNQRDAFILSAFGGRSALAQKAAGLLASGRNL